MHSKIKEEEIAEWLQISVQLKNQGLNGQISSSNIHKKQVHIQISVDTMSLYSVNDYIESGVL